MIIKIIHVLIYAYIYEYLEQLLTGITKYTFGMYNIGYTLLSDVGINSTIYSIYYKIYNTLG